MAGKEIYIGRMIEGLQQSIDEQVKEMEQVAGILADMAANYGVAVQQKAFTGTGLAAVPLVTYKYKGWGFSPNNPPSGAITGADSVSTTGATSGTSVTNADAYMDLTDCNQLVADFQASTTDSYAQPSILIDDVEVWAGTYGTAVQHAEVNLSEEDPEGNVNYLYQGNHKITFRWKKPQGKSYTYTVKNIKIWNDHNDDPLLPWPPSDLLAYNSANALAMATSAAGSGYGFIDFPAQMTGTEIATWVALIFQSPSLDGITLSLVDGDGNVLVPDLIRKNAIGELAVFDFYVKFEFTDPAASITGVILRYT